MNETNTATVTETVTPTTPETETPVVETTVETPKVNRSKLILAAFKAMGLDAPANDIVDAVKAQTNVLVTVSLVNNLRSRLRKSKKERAERRKATEQPQPATENDPLAKLFAVKEFAASVGGLEALKTLVSQLEKLAA